MGLYDSTFRLVLFAVSSIIVFAILILGNAALVQHTDLVRQQTQITRTQINSVPVDLTKLAENILIELQKNHPERRLQLSVAPNLNAHGDARLFTGIL